MIEFLKKRPWQEWLLCLIIISIIVLQAGIFFKFKHLPGPVFGGDLYFHYGHTQHIAEGGSVFRSSHFYGEYEHYPWFTHWFIAFISAVTRTSLFKVYLYFPLVMTIASGIIAYIIGTYLFKNKSISLLLSFLWMASFGMPSSTPTSFALKIMIPLVFSTLFFTHSFKARLLAGFLYGIAGFQHIVTFLGASLFILLLVIYRMYKEKSLKKQVKHFIPVLIIGIPLAFLYWFPPIAVYHANTPNNWQEYTGIGVEGLTFEFVTSMLKMFFLNFNSLIESILSLFSILGIYFCLKRRNEYAFPILFFLAGFLGIVHPIITKPLFGISLGFYRFPIIIMFAKSLFVICGIYWLWKKVPSINSRWLFFLAMLLLLSFNANSFIAKYKADRWAQYGMSQDKTITALFDIADWVKENTNVNDVFITPHGESAFALNALTSRKVLFMRRTHTSPYVDIDKRIADGAVILYGNNKTLRKKLLENYNITYLYFDFYSANAVKECIKQWDILEKQPDSSYNCLRVSNESLKEYIESAGIETKKVHARLDVASNKAPTFDIFAIKAKEVPNINASLLKRETINGEVLAAVFRISK